jgi:serine/threonine-protein kinase
LRGEGGDHRTDLFALGIVFWEMLAGRRLFSGESDTHTIRQIAKCEVPPLADSLSGGNEADALIRRLVTRNPDDRIHDAALLASQLRHWIKRKDWQVGPEDVATAVRAYRAEKSRMSQAPPVSTLLAEELEKFAEATADTPFDLGASPLDPASF